MSTRTDFYIGKGLKAKWIGSCIDGFCPIECERSEIINICSAKKEKDYIKFVNIMLDNKSHQGVTSDKGWQWDYETSAGSDYIYCFTHNTVRCSYRGSILFNPLKTMKKDDTILPWPNMEGYRKEKIIYKSDGIRIKRR